MRATIEEVGTGDAGVRRKLIRIRELQERAKRDPRFRAQALSLVAGLPPRDHDREIAAVVRFVRGRVRYVRDPWSPTGLELFVEPQLMLEHALEGSSSAQGDCDDMALLGGALLETLGYPTRSRVGGSRPDWRHVWTEVFHPERGWTPLEWTRAVPIGFDPAGRFDDTATVEDLAMHASLAPELGELGKIGKKLKRVTKILKPLLKIAAPLVATAVGGPAAGALVGKLTSGIGKKRPRPQVDLAPAYYAAPQQEPVYAAQEQGGPVYYAAPPPPPQQIVATPTVSPMPMPMARVYESQQMPAYRSPYEVEYGRATDDPLPQGVVDWDQQFDSSLTAEAEEEMELPDDIPSFGLAPELGELGQMKRKSKLKRFMRKHGETLIAAAPLVSPLTKAFGIRAESIRSAARSVRGLARTVAPGFTPAVGPLEQSPNKFVRRQQLLRTFMPWMSDPTAEPRDEADAVAQSQTPAGRLRQMTELLKGRGGAKLTPKPMKLPAAAAGVGGGGIAIAAAAALFLLMR
jgi:hypothetical protein